MPSRWIVALIIALLAPGAAAHNFVTGKTVTPVYIQEGGELLLNSDDEIHYQKWNSTQLVGKVRIIQYIAGRKSAKKKNSLLIKAVEAANFSQDRFQPTTIVNTDDAIFGTGYFVVGKIEKINAAIRGRNSLLTAMVWDALPGNCRSRVQPFWY